MAGVTMHTLKNCIKFMALVVPLAALDPTYGQSAAKLAPLPDLQHTYSEEQTALGKLLFFDGRLSGDASTSCSTCHSPDFAWADGEALSQGYPGSLYFRNTPTVVNAAYAKYFYWDGRLSGSDLPTLIRDHISEAHFMNADGRLIVERLRQIPDYEKAFKEAFGNPPTYGSMLKAVSAYVVSLRSTNVPLDRFLQGEADALTPEAVAGYRLFTGRAGCVQCHNGSTLSDGGFHRTGVPDNAEIFASPERHISFRRFMRTLGVSEFRNLRSDPGLYALTKVETDRGRFRTPSLREVSRTAPYMHNGAFDTLAKVVEFYDRGGDGGSELRELNLTAEEKANLLEFLEGLSGDVPFVDLFEIETPSYAARELGRN